MSLRNRSGRRSGQDVKNCGSGTRHSWALLPALPPTGCVTSGGYLTSLGRSLPSCQVRGQPPLLGLWEDDPEQLGTSFDVARSASSHTASGLPPVGNGGGSQKNPTPPRRPAEGGVTGRQSRPQLAPETAATWSATQRPAGPGTLGRAPEPRATACGPGVSETPQLRFRG